MRVPKSWLMELAPFEIDDAEMASTLDDLGLVVEAVDVVGAELTDDVVVAKVMEIGPVPEADRVRRVTVDIGTDSVDVVCGAWNFSEGDLVAMAKVGAELPGGLKIRRRKIKGVSSEGMLCSGAELGLSDDASGILVLGSPLRGSGHAPGTTLADALGARPEVVFDLAIEANRPDAMCIAGVARDLAARLKLPFEAPDHSSNDGRTVARTVAGTVLEAQAGGVTIDGGLATLRVEDGAGCPRFTATCITGIEVTQSPAWMARRLVLCGMRPINSVVDASNYVMLELGQPTHPYDLDLLRGPGLVVRSAQASDTLVTLDGVERSFTTTSQPSPDGRGGSQGRGDCLICDADSTPVGIAGIMGGASTQITSTTSAVLLEAAYFEPLVIARTSKMMGLRTEASVRFERGCDPGGIDAAVARLCSLIIETSGTKASSVPVRLDASLGPPRPERTRLRLSRLNSVLGTDLAATDVEAKLEPMGFSLSLATLATSAGMQDDSPAERIWDVTVPGFRPDVGREIDLIEEVARQHGYSRIKRTRPPVASIGMLNPAQRQRRLVRQVMVGLGACEAWTSTFVSDRDHQAMGITGGVEIANPLAKDEAILRRSLMPGLLRSCRLNQSRQAEAVRLFEVGRVFEASAGGVSDLPGGDRELGRARDPRPGEALPQPTLDALSIAPVETEALAALFSDPHGGLFAAMEAWRTLSRALGLEEIEAGLGAGVQLVAGRPPGLHPARSAWLVVAGPSASPGSPETAPAGTLGCVGEVSRSVSEAFGLDAGRGSVGWLEVDLSKLLAAPRRSRAARPVSRFPSNDVDLAFVVEDAVPAGAVEALLARVGGDLLETVRLFDVFRSGSLGKGRRSLAYRLRFCAADRTLSDSEVGKLRARCIDAVEQAFPARLRGS